MDIGEELKAKELPIPTAQRNDIFVATPNDALQRDWARGDLTAAFHYPESDDRDPASFCGIALFFLEFSYLVPRRVFELLRPFFKRAGREANVFEYCPIRRLFVRRDEEWFEGRVVETPAKLSVDSDLHSVPGGLPYVVG